MALEVRRPIYFLLSSQEANSRGEGTAVDGAEGQKFRGVDEAVHEESVLVIRDVVEAATNRPVKAKCVKTFFEVQVQAEPVRKAAGAGRFDELLLRVFDIEGKAAARLQRVSEVNLVKDGQLEKRQQPPGEETVWRVPAVGSGLLRTEDRVINIEIEHLVGSRAGTRVGSKNEIAVAKILSAIHMKRGVAIFAGVQ